MAVCEGGGFKEYVLTQYNVFLDSRLGAKALRNIFAGLQGESVSISEILYDPVEPGRLGRARWVAATAQPIKDKEGQIREVMLIHEISLIESKPKILFVRVK